jgi:hypothetical protein
VRRAGFTALGETSRGGRPSVSLITSGFPFLNSDAPTVDGHRDGYGDALSVCYCFRLMSYEGLDPPSLPSETFLSCHCAAP